MRDYAYQVRMADGTRETFEGRWATADRARRAVKAFAREVGARVLFGGAVVWDPVRGWDAMTDADKVARRAA